jgi:hypothetical protein
MGGGLLQLVASGAQDVYLSSNPQITFWKGLYKRHTNFAMEPFRLNLTGQPNWGMKQSVTLGRHADLAYSTYLEVVLPVYEIGSTSTKVDWNNEQGRLGYNLIRYVELEVGGQLIDRLYGEFLYLWDTLTSDANKSKQLWDMVGFGTNFTASTVGLELPDSASCSAATGRQGHPNVLYIPLTFFYTRNPGCALPLISLQYHETKINIQWNEKQFVSADFGTSRVSKLPAPVSAAVYVDYIYMDVEERRRMAQESHEYLIEQVQFNEDKGLSSASNRVDLTFNHPVKELIWVVQPERFTNCKIDNKANAAADTYGVPRPRPSGVSYSTGGGRLAPFTYTYPSQAGTDAADQTPVQPIFEQWIQFNGQDRLDKRYGNYYNRVQPYQHHSGSMVPAGFYNTPVVTGGDTVTPKKQDAIYCYSFALKPEEHQPSGTCNFSRIDTATIVMQMSGAYVVDESTDNSWNVRVYAINYNVLRVMSGMAGLSYSN